MNSRPTRSGLMMVLATLAAGVALAQMPGMVGRPGGQPVPAVPDTVDIRFTVPDSLPQPRAIHVVQDTLEFGGLLHLVLDYPPDEVDGPRLQPVSESEWLVPEPRSRPGFWARLRGRSNVAPVDLADLTPTTDLRVVRSFRIYRREPLRISWRDYQSPVLVVTGQTAGTAETAAIRAPRSLAWNPWRFLLVVILSAVLACLGYLWWRRRRRPLALAQWPVPAPAWLETALGLQALWTENILARGDTRLFLDRLAFLARDYVSERYRIAAREMTGDEIVAACVELGHDPAQPAGFARFIDRVDRERYHPDSPVSAFCREQAALLLHRVARVRLGRCYTPIPPEQVLAAEQAWAFLNNELGTGNGPLNQPAASGKVR